MIYDQYPLSNTPTLWNWETNGGDRRGAPVEHFFGTVQFWRVSTYAPSRLILSTISESCPEVTLPVRQLPLCRIWAGSSTVQAVSQVRAITAYKIKGG